MLSRDFETNINSYTSGVGAIATIGAGAAFGAMHDVVNRNIMRARTNAVRQQIADRVRRDRAECRQMARDLSIARLDAALARYHLNRLARTRPPQSRRY
jgi:type IV secretory pathway ATPase VirB11/archaellum biosynthesis ATPase